MVKQLLILIFSFVVTNGVLANWSDPIQIASGNTPDIAVDRNGGNVHILSIGAGGLVYTKCDPQGVIQSQEGVPGAGAEVGGSNFGASIAVDTQGNPHVVYRVKTGSPFYEGYYIFKRSNGTWSTPLKLYDALERGYNVRIAMDDYDNVHIVHSEYVSGVGQVSYIRINNGQITKSIPRFVSNSAYRPNDHLELDVTRSGKFYVVMGNPTNGRDCYVFMSPDQGATISHIGFAHESVLQDHTGSPDIFVDANANIHIIYGTIYDNATSYKPSVRYSKWVGNSQWHNTNISASKELDPWGSGADHGIGSIAASDEGKYLIAVYSKTAGGQLRWRYSSDYGVNWTDRSELAPIAGNSDGRDKAKVRAYSKRFYAVYSSPDGSTYLRIYCVPGFDPPVANAGGPYSGTEGTAINFNGGASTDDKGITKYEWDWNNDGSYDAETSNAIFPYAFPDNYSGTIKLKVTDIDGLTDIDETTVTVSNANPTPNPGGNVSGNEGSSISFSVSVSDPGSNDGPFTYQWNFGDGQTSTQQNPSHSFPDNGNYTVTVSAWDKDGGMGQAQTTANISNVNPTAEAGGPYSGRIQQAVALSGSAADPGTNENLQYAWDADNNGSYELTGQNVSAYFNSPGSHTVKLKVSDKDGGVDYDDATVTVDTESPNISPVPDQIVNEGTAFPALHLDDYVSDLDNPDNELSWTYSGNDSLTVSLQNRIVNVTVPYAEWSGYENITFQVEDPDHHTAQTTVKYEVRAVNDSPVLGPISDQFINEDDTTTIYRANLVALVTDPDNSADDFQFEVINSTKIHAYYDYQVNGLKIYADQNWFGQETATMKVSDGAGGVGTRDFKVYVCSQPDPPLPFNLISPLNTTYTSWPASINFQWNNTTDPDQGETVSYVWQLSKYSNFQSIVNQSNSILTNSYTFNNTQQKTPGIYYWRVEATGSDGLAIYSTNTGQIILDAKMPVVSPIPNQTIYEGGSFDAIQLDNYVHDEDNSDAEISWQAYGQSELAVTISNRVATVTIPRSDWYGIEHIIFEATDPIGLKDSATVTFTVTDVNAKPVLRSPGQITFLEDFSYTLARSTLEALVTDEDNSGADFSFSLAQNRKVKYSIQENGNMLLFADPDTCGNETVLLVVDDGAGAKDSADMKVSITPVPDPPKAFDLVSPPDNAAFMAWFPIMQFMWTAAVDPDPGQSVFYLWYLSKTSDFNEEDIIATATIMDQTTYNYQADKKIYKGAYYWKVIATGYDGGMTQSNQVHVLSLLSSVEPGPGNSIPGEFKLLQNHPNPFNCDTWISYHLPENAGVTLRIFNNLGQSIRTLIDEEKPAGIHQVVWDGRNDLGRQVSSGIYFYHLQAGKKIALKKMLLIQ